MRRLKKILKWTAICVAVSIALLLVANTYFVRSTGIELERRLLELRQAGEPIQLSDLAHPPLAPEQDAEVYLQRAMSGLEAIHKELQTIYPGSGVPTSKPSADDLARIRKAFDAHPAVMPLIEQAAACSDYDPKLDVTLSTNQFLQPLMDRAAARRLVVRTLRTRSSLLTFEGKWDEAVENGLTSLRLTRLWLREPCIISHLVTIACQSMIFEGLAETLQAGSVSPGVRQSLDAELALHDSLEGLRLALKSERAYSLSTTWDLPNARLWITRGFANNLQLSLLETFGSVVQQVDTPYAEVIQTRKIDTPPPSRLNPLQPLAQLLTPALDAARAATERTRAVSRCLRVLNALQTKGMENHPLTPNLTELGLPPEAIIDPYNGEPLRIKRDGTAWLVYSVGHNLTDDGGNLTRMIDVGVGPKPNP